MKIKGHLELEEGEVFLGNFDDCGYKGVGWKTKRSGEIPYDIDGNILEDIPNFFPVFVQRQELEEAGISFGE